MGLGVMGMASAVRVVAMSWCKKLDVTSGLVVASDRLVVASVPPV